MKRLVQLAIRGYQNSFSRVLPVACRYEPTCSHYAYEAVGRYGVLKGGWMALRRLVNCRPGGGSGYDPVP